MTDQTQMTPRDYEVIEYVDNVGHLKFTHPPFNTIIFSYGEVKVNEVNEEAILSFDYTIHSGEIPEDSLNEFRNELGDLLLGMITEQLARNTTIFSGGIDEQNRNNNNQSVDNE